MKLLELLEDEFESFAKIDLKSDIEHQNFVYAGIETNVDYDEEDSEEEIRITLTFKRKRINGK